MNSIEWLDKKLQEHMVVTDDSVEIKMNRYSFIRLMEATHKGFKIEIDNSFIDGENKGYKDCCIDNKIK